MKKISIRKVQGVVSSTEKRKIEAYAKKEGRSVSNLLRQLLIQAGII